MFVDDRLDKMLEVSIALSTEKNSSRLLEHILLTAKSIANADGGTIYRVNNDTELIFDTLINDSLDLYQGGASGQAIDFPSIPIFNNAEVNTQTVVSQSAGQQQVINVADIYEDHNYDFTGAKRMDTQTGYRTQSMLTIPLSNHEGDLNGVLQLINARDDDNKVIPFSPEVEYTVKAMAGLAATVLTNRNLVDSMENLFEAFSRLIAKAIDEKSPYTGGHCRRVPELTMMIANAVHRHKEGPLADFAMTEADSNELSLAGWMHDCGKIATPESVMDKATKLQTIFDRIELVITRLELAKRDIEIEALKAQADSDIPQEKRQEYQHAIRQLEDDQAFLIKANTGGEFMTTADQQRVADIAKHYCVSINGQTMPLLSEDEVYNLQISRGTLTPEERQVINQHMDLTCDMLEALPFPKHLRRVPEFAGGHHEKMDGSGYPKGLTREQMSVPARMMAIADIFEALTASDRPYKEAKALSECLDIMSRMSQSHHIDHELFEIFVQQKVYLNYAERFLAPQQIDHVDEQAILARAVPDNVVS